MDAEGVHRGTGGSREVHWLEFLVLVKPSTRSTLGMECSFESGFPQYPSPRLYFSLSPRSLSLPHFCKLCPSEPSKERVMEDGPLEPPRSRCFLYPRSIIQSF